MNSFFKSDFCNNFSNFTEIALIFIGFLRRMGIFTILTLLIQEQVMSLCYLFVLLSNFILLFFHICPSNFIFRFFIYFTLNLFYLCHVLVKL